MGMHYCRILILIFSLVFSSIAIAGQGYIEKNGIRMPIKDTLVVIDRTASTMHIYMFPSRLSSNDKRLITKNNSAIAVLWNKPSPDKKKWQWYPYAMLKLTGKNNKVNDVGDVSNYFLKAYAIEEKSFTDNVNGYFSAKDKPKSFKKRGSKVELKYSGINKYTKLKWNLSINAVAREK